MPVVRGPLTLITLKYIHHFGALVDDLQAWLAVLGAAVRRRKCNEWCCRGWEVPCVCVCVCGMNHSC